MSSTSTEEIKDKVQLKAPLGKRQRKILSPATQSSASSAGSSNQPESPTKRQWRMSNGEVITLQGQRRIVSQLVATVGPVAAVGKDVDLVIGIDPGPLNSGMAYFLRCAKTREMKLELAVQLETKGIGKDALPFYFLSVAVRFANDLNLVAETERLPKVNSIGFAVEQAAQYSFDNHIFIHSFRAILEAMAAPLTDFKFQLITISPESVRRSLCLLKQTSYALRKQKTFECITNGLKIKFPRHDTTDAVSLGITAVTCKRYILKPTEFADDAMWPFFATDEELEEATEKKVAAKEAAADIPMSPVTDEFDELLYSELFDEKDEDY